MKLIIQVILYHKIFKLFRTYGHNIIFLTILYILYLIYVGRFLKLQFYRNYQKNLSIINFMALL